MRPSSLDTPTLTAKWLFLGLVVFFDKNKKEKKRSPPEEENEYGHAPIPYRETPPL